MDTPSSQKPHTGFTLIELLVVIAIIAILAAILFPVFAKAREKARAIACTSNQKQLVLGFLQYTQDNDESFPRGIGNANGQGVGWAARIYPYVKSAGVYHCPDDPTTTTTNLAGFAETDYPVSYSANHNVMADQNMAVLNAPASTVILCETQGAQADVTNPQHDGPDSAACCGVKGASGVANGGDGPGYAGYDDWVYASNEPNNNPVYVCGDPSLSPPTMGQPPRTNQKYFGAQVHTGSANFALADGHVKFLHAAHISPGGDAASSNVTQTAAGAAAGTGYMGQAPENFVATFSTK